MNHRKILAITVSVLVLAVVIYGMTIAGSPDRARKLQLDRQRIDRLRQTANAINQYYNDRKEMPANLEEVATGYDPVLQDFLKDPETGAFHEYSFLPSPSSSSIPYVLCANFSLDFSAQPDANSRYAVPTYVGEKGPVDPFLAGYQAGRTCFSMQIVFSDSNVK